MPPPPELEEVLERLRARFVAEAPDLAARLRAGLAQADDAELRAIAHRLAGSAGVFGFGEIGATAAALEAGLAGLAGAGEAQRQLAAALAAALAGLARVQEVTST